MKYSHTIQIITKDIQDIEKMVKKFDNYSSIPAIELDLALSKLRNVYDLLLMFREISLEGLSMGKESVQGINKEENRIQEEDRFKSATLKDPISENPGDQIKEAITITPETDKESPEVSDEVTGSVIVIPEAEKKVPEAEKKVPENVKETPEVDNEVSQPLNKIPESDHLLEIEEPRPPVKEEKKTVKAGSVLGEKFKPERKYINESIGEQTKKADLKSKIQGGSINSIAGSIGINDKFFYIRELFNGDAESFRSTMETLDHSQNFNEAFNYLNEHFDWDMESEAAQQLLYLTRRKFISPGDE